MEKLEPKERSTPNISEIDTFAKNMGKRSGGGSVQVGLMFLGEIANTIVPCNSGFDKKSANKYNSQLFVLSRFFEEHGWPLLNKAIVLAGVRKYVIDPEDGFIPLAPGTIDIEAALEMNPEHRELQIFGDMRKKMEVPLELYDLNSIIGFATEYGNGQDSLETILPIFTPGIWKEIKDIQFNRPTGMVIVTPYITLWCENMSINNLVEVPMNLVSVKMLETIKIVKHFCNNYNIG